MFQNFKRALKYMLLILCRPFSHLNVGDLSELDEVIVEVSNLVESGRHFPQLQAAVGRVEPGPRRAAQPAHVEVASLTRRLALQSRKVGLCCLELTTAKSIKMKHVVECIMH